MTIKTVTTTTYTCNYCDLQNALLTRIPAAPWYIIVAADGLSPEHHACNDCARRMGLMAVRSEKYAGKLSNA